MKHRPSANLACLCASLCLAWCTTSSADPVDFAGSIDGFAEATTQVQWKQEKIRSLRSRVGGVSQPPQLSELPKDASGQPEHARLFDDSINRRFLVISGRPVLRPAPVGILLVRHGEYRWPGCSLVLTRPDTVLTARHCLSTSDALRHARVFFPYEGIRRLADVGAQLPCKGIGGICQDDIVALRLAQPYRLIPVARRGEGTQAIRGMAATALGYGASNLLLSDRGLMHAGTLMLETCSCAESVNKPAASLCFHMDHGPSATSLWQFANFGGDSGCGLFSGDGSEHELIGLSSGFDRVCEENLIEGRFIDLRALAVHDSLDGVFCEEDCTRFPMLSHEVLVEVLLAYVSEEGADHHAATIHSGATELLVNLNHETAGFQPEPVTDLSIVMPATLEGECSRYYGVESCHVSNPPPGAYSIGIQRESGNPAYQLTVVAIYEE